MALVNRNAFMAKLNTLETGASTLDDRKIKLLDAKLTEVMRYYANISELDLDLQSYMVDSENTNTSVVLDTEFHTKMNDIASDSLIIYVKKAGLYKIYSPDGMDDFIQDEGTHYHKSQYGPVYEVIRDVHPQKLMIVFKEDMGDDELMNIKQYIMNFIHTEPSLPRTDSSELKIYSNDNNTEFIVSGVLLRDMYEKEKFIDKFTRFVQQQGELTLADKIQLRLPLGMVDGSRLIKIPSIKTPRGHSNNNVTTDLITSSIGQMPVIINQTITIINNGDVNNGTINNSTNVKNVTKNKTKAKTLKSFFKFIIDSKPEWYDEGKYVDFSIIADEYRIYFDSNLGPTGIAKQLSGKLYNTSTRSNNVVRKKLVTFAELKKKI